MRDGVTLSVDIYRPDVDRPFPVDPDQDAVQQQHRAGCRAGQMVRRARLRRDSGDVRGKFDSAGDFYPFKHEPDDGFDTDEWIAKQPWFDGKLGTMGGSWLASRSGAEASRQPLSDGDGGDRHDTGHVRQLVLHQRRAQLRVRALVGSRVDRRPRRAVHWRLRLAACLPHAADRRCADERRPSRAALSRLDRASHARHALEYAQSRGQA